LRWRSCPHPYPPLVSRAPILVAAVARPRRHRRDARTPRPPRA
jgi:hypothetical protein